MTIDDIDTGQLDELEADLEQRRLPGRRCTVTMPDGQTHTLRITNRELVLWDKTAPRHKWGAVDDVPFLAQSFTAWAAARREGIFPGGFDAWNELELELRDEAEDATDVARPTRPGPGPGSS